MAFEIREARAGDERAILAALETLGAPRTLEEWRWAFERNPAGRRVFLALDGARVVGQFAALPHKLWIAGREAFFAEVVDSFVLPGVRRGLQREGLYVRLANALGERYGSGESDLVHYGFPSAGEWKLGKSLLDYEVVRTQTVLVRAADERSSELPRGLERLARFDHQARWLWDRCAGGFGASVIRDERFLNWRFVERPGARYELLGARDAQGILRGYAVVRRAPAFASESGQPLGSGRETLLVADWLVPPSEPEVGELLLAGVRALARGVPTITALFPEWSPWFETFQRAGFLVHDADRFLFNRSFAKKFDELWLREHWWTTPADFLEG